MITESKKIKTRSGSTMMSRRSTTSRARVEVVVFEKALAAAEEVLAADAIVLVRGRVDHKEAGKGCIIVQDVEQFDPSEAEIEKAKGGSAQRAAARCRSGCACASTPRAWRRRSSPSCASCSSAIPARTSSCSRCTRASGVRRLRFGDGYKIAGHNGALAGGARTGWLGPSAGARPRGIA